ncbi:MAG: hypothetical protein ACOYOT_04290 [Bacteroidales bacterium]
MNPQNKTSKLATLATLLFCMIAQSSMAQVALIKAMDKTKGLMDYEIVYGTDKEPAINSLYSKGFNNCAIYSQEAYVKDDYHITKGFMVLVVYNEKASNGAIYRHMGIGISRTSYQEAEERAAGNLGTYYWSWYQAKGYEVVQRSLFDFKTEEKTYVAVKAVFKKDEAGNKKLIAVSLSAGSTTDEEYGEIRKQLGRTSERNEIYVTRIFARIGDKVAVIKSTSVSDKNISTDKIQLICSNSEGKYNVELSPEGTVTHGNEPAKYVLYSEMKIEKESFTLEGLIKQQLRKKLKEDMKNNPERKSTSVHLGIRG